MVNNSRLEGGMMSAVRAGSKAGTLHFFAAFERDASRVASVRSSLNDGSVDDKPSGHQRLPSSIMSRMESSSN
jgi:hypothetical protein